MKIILANRYFFPDQSATSRMVSGLAFSLARKGFSVAAIAGRQSYGNEATLPPRECIDGVDIHRLAASSFGRGRLAGRAADYATFQMSAAAWIIAHASRGDICVACTDPPLLSVAAALPLKLRGAHLVNWVMDLFPEAAMELGVVPRTGPASRFALVLRDQSLRTAALTICPIEAMTRHLERRIGPRSRLTTVHHWADDAEIHPVDPSGNTIRAEWGLEDAFVVGYSGNFGRAHEFATLLAAASALRSETDIRFLMIGDGQQRADTEAEARRLGLTNMIFRPYQPRERLAESLGAADVHIVSLLPSLEHCIIPSKFYGVLAAGRPTIFIGDGNGAVATAVREGGCGDTVRPGDWAGLAARIVRLRDAREERLRMGVRARTLLHREYTLDRGVARWLAAIEHLLPLNSTLTLPSVTDGIPT